MNYFLFAIGLFIAVIVTTPISAQAPAPAPPTLKSILAEGAFSFSDGSSVFTFHDDHTFTLGPTSLSGRTITGIWKSEDHVRFTIIGKWSWVNGLSINNDFRQMTIHISYHGEGKQTLPGGHQHVVFPTYFTIEALTPITAEEYTREMKSKTTPTP